MWTVQQVTECKRLLQHYKTVKDISEHFGCTPHYAKSLIARARKRKDVPPAATYKAFTVKDRNLIAKLTQQEPPLSLKEMCELTGIPLTRLHSYERTVRKELGLAPSHRLAWRAAQKSQTSSNH